MNAADPQMTDINYLVQVDAKGIIPKMILNQTSKTLGFMPMRVNKAIHKVKAKKN